MKFEGIVAGSPVCVLVSCSAVLVEKAFAPSVSTNTMCGSDAVCGDADNGLVWPSPSPEVKSSTGFDATFGGIDDLLGE